MAATDERSSESTGLGSLEVNLATYRAFFAGRELTLSSSELALLAILICNRRRVISRAELAENLSLRRDRTVDVMLSTLRKKLGRDFVHNVPKRGWILEPEQLEE